MDSVRGQTMVELALVLPCFCLGIFMAVQLMVYCHNMVELQRMAQVALHRVTIDNYRGAYKHYWFHSLYGDVTPPRDHYASQAPSPWRPFGGIHTIDDPGRLVRVSVETTLRPYVGFTHGLAKVGQSAQAEALLEPSFRDEH